MCSVCWEQAWGARTAEVAEGSKGLGKGWKGTTARGRGLGVIAMSACQPPLPPLSSQPHLYQERLTQVLRVTGLVMVLAREVASIRLL